MLTCLGPSWGDPLLRRLKPYLYNSKICLLKTTLCGCRATRPMALVRSMSRLPMILWLSPDPTLSKASSTVPPQRSTRRILYTPGTKPQLINSRQWVWLLSWTLCPKSPRSVESPLPPLYSSARGLLNSPSPLHILLLLLLLFLLTCSILEILRGCG